MKLILHSHRQLVLRLVAPISAALAVMAFYASVKMRSGDAVTILGCLFTIIAALAFGCEGIMDWLEQIRDKDPL